MAFSHQEDGDKDQEVALMRLNPLSAPLFLPKRPSKGSSLLTGADSDAETSLIPDGFVLLHVVLDQLKGSKSLSRDKERKWWVEEKRGVKKSEKTFLPGPGPIFGSLLIRTHKNTPRPTPPPAPQIPASRVATCVFIPAHHPLYYI